MINETAQGISDFGILVMVAAVFLVGVWLMFKHLISTSKATTNLLINSVNDTMKKLVESNKNQEEAISELASCLKPANDIQIRNIVNTYFDLYHLRICYLIKEVRTENHLTDRETVRRKIFLRVSNLFKKRNSEFDYIRYRNRALSEYTDSKWVEKMANLVEQEVYNTEENEARTYNAVKSMVEENKMSFLDRINGL